MRLSDIMGGLNLAAFPLIAMVMFAAIFLAVLVRVFGRGRREDLARAAALPLDEALDELPPADRSRA